MKASGLPPDSREQGTLLLYNKEIILYGGISNRAFPYVYNLDLQTRTWTSDDTLDRVELRYYKSGHTATLMGKNMVVFGGETKDPMSKHSKLTMDVM